MKPFMLFPAGLVACIILSVILPESTYAQLPRERVVTDDPVSDVFPALSNIGIGTVRNLQAKNLNSTVMHTFGLVEGGIDRFFGMDDGANTRIGLDYGISDRISAGIGRMTFNNVVDLRSKYNILRQTETGSTPVGVAAKVAVGIDTRAGTGLVFSDKLSYFASVMAARKFNELSLQLSPMLAHFNFAPGANQNTLVGLGIAANYALNDRYSLSAEYLPVLSTRNPGTADAMGVALNIETGGHLFQIFFTSSQWHNEAYIMANNRDRFWEGDLRLGFNIHRVFGL